MQERYLRQLIERQRVAQESKVNFRNLRLYKDILFYSSPWEGKSPIVDFFESQFGGTRIDNLPFLLEKMAEGKEGKLVWVDMGGGKGLPMYNLRQDHSDIAKAVRMINVDLFEQPNQSLDVDDPDLMERLRMSLPGITFGQGKPFETIIQSAEVVQLPEKADLSTSVESIQYLNDPFWALANWYNQLKDGGIMMVASYSGWSYRMSTGEHDSRGRKSLVMPLLEKEMKRSGVAYIITGDVDEETGLSREEIVVLVIRKKKDTQMVVWAEAVAVNEDAKRYKDVVYRPAENGKWVEIVSGEGSNIRGRDFDYGIQERVFYQK